MYLRQIDRNTLVWYASGGGITVGVVATEIMTVCFTGKALVALERVV